MLHLLTGLQDVDVGLAHLWGQLRQLPQAADWLGAHISIYVYAPFLPCLFSLPISELENKRGRKKKFGGEESADLGYWGVGEAGRSHWAREKAFGMPPHNLYWDESGLAEAWLKHHWWSMLSLRN